MAVGSILSAQRVWCGNGVRGMKTGGSRWKSVHCMVGGGKSGEGGGRVKVERRAVMREEVVQSAECQVIEKPQNSASILPPAYPTFGGSPSRDCIGYGMLEETDAFYRERFVVRFSEVGDRGTTSLETLASLLQEAACNHVLKIGYGAFPGMNERLITVTTRMHIEVDRYPAWRDLLEIDTWFCTEGRNAVRRDWTVRDVRSGENIASATSTWVLMHMDTKTIHRITDNIRAEFAPWVRDPPMWALSEDRREASAGRISRINGDSEFQVTGLYPSDTDFDMNQHVNNVKYISWTLESIPREFREKHEVSKITLEYRREACKGDIVDSLAKVEPLNNTNGNLPHKPHEEPAQQRYIHMIRNQNGQEINKGRTIWRRLSCADK